MYSQITHDILVEVTPKFVLERSNFELRYYFFAYAVRIENLSSHWCRLMRRRWIIRDGSGEEEHVVGDGVVGETPVLLPGEVYSYTSACPLRTPTGSMRGGYEFVSENGEKFFVKVPLFFLRHDTLMDIRTAQEATL